MAFWQEFPDPTGDAGRAWRWPVGAASPLWAVFGALASAGVAYWWMTRWARPVNVEARTAPASEAEGRSESAHAPAPATAEPQVMVAVVEAAASPAAAEAADDLMRLTGIGPKLSRALAERGVTRFAQIAAWSDEDLAEIDAALGLKGRAARDAWVDQARRLAEASGPKPPGFALHGVELAQ